MMKLMSKSISIALVLVFISLQSSAHVRLPQIVRDSMVLQRDSKVNIWGWASAGERIAVRFNEKSYKTNDSGGERLALAALKLAYQEDIVYSGPLPDTALIQGNEIIISFKHAEGGLITNDNDGPSEFAIAGADKKFVWANAKIEGDKIIVWSNEITAPLYVRYAWADNPVNPNVYNKSGLPASPFKTDR